MEAVEVFRNREFGEIRTVLINNEPYFVGKDVAVVLGYAEPRSTVSKKVDAEDRGVAKLETPSGVQEMTVINESGLYALILGSKLESAKRFKHWVTSEVLPSIRKHGMYAVDELLENPDLLIKVATELKDERQRRVIAENECEELRQELDYSKDWYSIKRVAAMNGVDWKSFDWRRLKQKSIQLGYGVKKIFDANYGEVNTYHREVWESVYPEYEI